MKMKKRIDHIATKKIPVKLRFKRKDGKGYIHFNATKIVEVKKR